MKQKVMLYLVFPILLQSCYSYKTVEISKTNLKQDNVYVINSNGKTQKGILIEENDSVTRFKIKNKIEEYSKKDITSIKDKKFSILKTIGLFTGVIVVGTTIGVAISLNNINPKPLNSFPQ